jgi:hypothetical protein
MKTALLVLTLLGSLATVKSFAQDNMGIGTSTPDPSSVLDLTATDKGLLVPRMDAVQRIAIALPATGLMVFDTDDNQFWYFDGTIWVQALGPQGPAGAGGTNGTNGTNGLDGAQGPTGIDGAVGATGNDGAVGAQGPTGIDGAVGATGNDGAVGAQGPTGIDGAVGATGNDGAVGAQGPTGIDGAVGATGNDGAVGVQGPTGVDGAIGATGIDGAVGVQGPTGVDGAVGATGPAGPVGCNSANYIVKSNGSIATCSQIFDNGIRIGIGTGVPAHYFHHTRTSANGAVYVAKFELTGAADANVWIANTSTTNGSFAANVTIDYTGTALIATGIRAGSFATGTGTPSRGVHGLSNTYEGTGVYGARFNDGGADVGWGGLFINDLGYTGGLFNASDRKIKKGIRPIESALDKVMSINGVNYEHDLDKYPTMGLGDNMQYGFIAQELEAVLPELVQQKSLPTGGARKASADASMEENTNETFKMVNYIGVIPVLVEAIKEQQRIIEEMKLEIEALQNNQD